MESLPRKATTAPLFFTVCLFGGTLLLLLSLSIAHSKSQAEEEGRTYAATDVLAPNDELDFAAIQSIHGQLDDNDDGSVDLKESQEFVQTELCGNPSSEEGQKACWSSEKSQRFHESDQQITSIELWMAWHSNKVFNWTNSDVIAWLENHVHLPQYSESFKRHKITGRHLPKIASNTGQMLQNVLLIADSQHKQKIQLRAMDLILFGPPVGSGHWKDAITLFSVTISVIGILFALRQRHSAQSRIDSFLEDMREKEKELDVLKSKLQSQEEEGVDGTTTITTEDESSLERTVAMGRSETSSPEPELLAKYQRSSSLPESSLQYAQQEITMLSQQVWSLESELENNQSRMTALHGLLQVCYRREKEHLDNRKKVAEDQMTQAQKVCDKIKKRRSSVFGTFHLANSSALEEAGLQITKAVNKMQIISECFSEYNKRWKKIEEITGLSIRTRPNTPTHTYSLTTATTVSSERNSPLPPISYSSSTSTVSSEPSPLQRRATLSSFPPSLPITHSVPYMRMISDNSPGEFSFSSRASSLSSRASQDSDTEFSSSQLQSPLTKTTLSSLQQSKVVVPTSSSHESLRHCNSLPVLVRKDSYNEAMDCPSSGDMGTDETDGESGVITFSVAEKSSPAPSSNQHSKRPMTTTEFKKGRRTSVQNLESIKEEDRLSGSTSSSPDRPNSRGHSPKLKVHVGKSLKYNTTAKSSEV